MIRAILSYLREHPDAQDTLDGIVEWWLVDQHIRRESRLVEDVLKDLVAKGVLVEHETPGSQPRYGIGRKRKDEVDALLERLW